MFLRFIHKYIVHSVWRCCLNYVCPEFVLNTWMWHRHTVDLCFWRRKIVMIGKNYSCHNAWNFTLLSCELSYDNLTNVFSNKCCHAVVGQIASDSGLNCLQIWVHPIISKNWGVNQQRFGQSSSWSSSQNCRHFRHIFQFYHLYWYKWIIRQFKSIVKVTISSMHTFQMGVLCSLQMFYKGWQNLCEERRDISKD